MFSFFESLIRPTAAIEIAQPPTSLLRFCWYFARQAKGLLAALFVAGLCTATLDAAVPWFTGRLVRLISSVPREALIVEHAPFLVAMVAIVLVMRPMASAAQNLISNVGIVAGLTNLVRWQSHRYVVRQSWPFFQKDFAGRIATRVLETGPAVRQSAIGTITAVWGILVYGTSALILLGSADTKLMVPLALWFVGYASALCHFVPRIHACSKTNAKARSLVAGRIVDSYNNIFILKLFGQLRHEDVYMRDAIEAQTRAFRQQLRMMSRLFITLQGLNALMVTGDVALAVLLWRAGRVDVGVVAMTIPLTGSMAASAGWVAAQVTDIFDQIGTIQEGMVTIAQPIALRDAEGARDLEVRRGEVRFEHIRFGYGRGKMLIDDLSLLIQPGEKIGIVGRSGAGKTTLVNLLLRFHDLEGGRILIDGQDIALVTQESLRGAVSVVTQDTSLLHRSISANIALGRPGASEDEIAAAARRAHAHDFILDLEDSHGRCAYQAEVGERGVKLSAGQRQRVAIARLILKNAPILVLDEATSALDSEVEAAIQDSLSDLMEGKTVIAIAHRLSTIAQLDRLIIVDRGRIIETGTHADLLRSGGIYANLWKRQSGGFIDAQATEAV